MPASRLSCFIGLMTGTSLDGIDAALLQFESGSPQLLTTHSEPLPESLRADLLALTRAGDDEIERLMRCDRELAFCYADAVAALLAKADLPPSAVTAIGCHGQTLRHRPQAKPAWTLQIGDPATLAVHSGIAVVADFRRQDIAAGGQGAPLAPGFHDAVFRSATENRVIANIGGIANITVLTADRPATGGDTGPGNSLLDLWVREQRGQAFDANGDWARSGRVQEALVERWLQDDWLQAALPKSTGREVFGLDWLQRQPVQTLPAADVQASLTAFTVRSLARTIRREAPAGSAVYVCGGGAHNGFLMQELAAALPGFRLETTVALGIAPDWVEAAAFAWLAQRRLAGLPGNLPSVTGASRPLVLGGLYLP